MIRRSLTAMYRSLAHNRQNSQLTSIFLVTSCTTCEYSTTRHVNVRLKSGRAVPMASRMYLPSVLDLCDPHSISFQLSSMAASFYSSPLIGATTTLACFAHEIPHEIADYSILVRSGFTKRQAMQSQFLTAVGAFVSGLHCVTRQYATDWRPLLSSPPFLPCTAHLMISRAVTES